MHLKVDASQLRVNTETSKTQPHLNVPWESIPPHQQIVFPSNNKSCRKLRTTFMRLESLAADDVNIIKEKHSPVITAIVIATCNPYKTLQPALNYNFPKTVYFNKNDLTK